MNFEYGEGTTAAFGCGVVFKGEYFYFGGENPNTRQVSALNVYSKHMPTKSILIRILTFDLRASFH